MLQKVQVIANCRDFKFFPRRKRAPCDYLFIAKNVTADGNEDVRAPEVYKEATQLRDKMRAVLGQIEARSLPTEVLDFLSSEIPFAVNRTISNRNSEIEKNETIVFDQTARLALIRQQRSGDSASNQVTMRSKNSNVSNDFYKYV